MIAPVLDRSRPGETERLPRRPFVGWVRATHVWLGLLTAVPVLVVCATGIALNHSGTLGWGTSGPPGVNGSGALADVAPLNDLLRHALVEAGEREVLVITDLGGVYPATGPSDIDRALFRPVTATVQVRLKDPQHTEVTLDWSTGAVLDVRPRHDVRLAHLHSGEGFGQRAVIVSDVAAVVMVILAVGGAVLWIRRLRRRRPARGAVASRWVRWNWSFHLVAGLAVVVYTIVLSATGVILNHKREWGFMIEPARHLDDEVVARAEPAALSTIVEWAVDERRRRGDEADADDVRFVDYRPLAGYAKVRFDDAETEVIVDAYEGRVQSVSHRRDLWIEHLHSGVRFGPNGTWISDVTAGLVMALTLNGLYLWLRPAVSGRSRPAGPSA